MAELTAEQRAYELWHELDGDLGSDDSRKANIAYEKITQAIRDAEAAERRKVVAEIRGYYCGDDVPERLRNFAEAIVRNVELGGETKKG